MKTTKLQKGTYKIFYKKSIFYAIFSDGRKEWTLYEPLEQALLELKKKGLSYKLSPDSEVFEKSQEGELDVVSIIWIDCGPFKRLKDLKRCIETFL
jgi:hypothetical protein